MFIPDPDFFSRVSDPGNNKKGEGEKIWCLTIFGFYKLYKIVNYLIYERIQKKCETFDKEFKNVSRSKKVPLF
jgi:hypothetical protein